MNESPLFTRTYDLMMWFLPRLQDFPRAHRFGLTDRIQTALLDFQDNITAAGKSQGEERKRYLHLADIRLEQLRLWVRLVRDQKFITVRQYEHAARLLNEVGRLLGGWLKKME